MRVLLVPELYRPDNATANGTLNDLITLADEWLARDDRLHLYWLLPPRDRADYDPEYVLADRERVTLIEAEPLVAGDEFEGAFVESGHSEAEFDALRRELSERGAYLDVVVDQLVTGRYDLYKWLSKLGAHRAASLPPVELVGYVHDLRLPFKEHGSEFPGGRPTTRELVGATVCDGLWFKAGIDRRRMREYGEGVVADETLDSLVDEAVETGSPIDFSGFDSEFADEPRRVHVAGSGWGKKNPDVVLDVCETLYEQYGIRTTMTNMDPILDAFEERPFVDAYPEASREEYERALREGDLTVCASDHETMARTWFEQAASGQVLVARDRPWIHDCVPDDYRLLGDVDELEAVATWAVENWDEAVSAAERLVDHVTTVRSPARCGRRTHDDLRRRVDARVAAYEAADTAPADEAVRAVLASADGGPVAVDDLAARAAERAGAGNDSVLDRDDYALVDLVHALRSAGWADTGNPGTPAFEPVDADRDGPAGADAGSSAGR